MIFPTDLKPMFARLGSITGYRTVQEDRWRKTFLFSLGLKSPLSDRERTAFDLYTCAQDAREFGDARFVLLFAALETLLEDSSRPSEVVQARQRADPANRGIPTGGVREEVARGFPRMAAFPFDPDFWTGFGTESPR
jgi:hypothetical protein